MIYPTLLMLTGIVLIIGLVVFQRLSVTPKATRTGPRRAERRRLFLEVAEAQRRRVHDGADAGPTLMPARRTR
jgi:hypothetical protein